MVTKDNNIQDDKGLSNKELEGKFELINNNENLKD